MVLGDDWHLKGGIDYLPADLLAPDEAKAEVSAQILAGFHTRSLFSFHADAGLGMVFDWNSSSAALASQENTLSETVYPDIFRVSLSLPLHVGLSIYTGPSFSVDIRFEYNGLTFTLEPLSPQDHNAGNVYLRYAYGFSPWSLLSFSIKANAGVRF